MKRILLFLKKIFLKIIEVYSEEKLDREQIVDKYAKKYNLEPEMIKAIIKVESSNNKYAIRYEPHYRWLYNPENFSGWRQSLDTEKKMQKTSWGLMQIMGGLARELGFDGAFLSELIEPEINIKYGCMYLSSLNDRYENIVEVIAAYNAGSPRKKENGEFVNQDYVNKVLDDWE